MRNKSGETLLVMLTSAPKEIRSDTIEL